MADVESIEAAESLLDSAIMELEEALRLLDTVAVDVAQTVRDIQRIQTALSDALVVLDDAWEQCFQEESDADLRPRLAGAEDQGGHRRGRCYGGDLQVRLLR